jgi:3-oxo-5-alpha-steroid 4-dehydrogenase 1
MWLRHWRDGNRPPALWSAGMLLWAAGAVVNIQADQHLLDLRQAAAAVATGDSPDAAGDGVAMSSYHIPQAGLFRYVSAANYLGEILEWAGYAAACGHVAAYSFAFFTACMLAPRAVQHHRDYQARFGWQYPYQRKALVPWLW